jgi:hypothetical protein
MKTKPARWRHPEKRGWSGIQRHPDSAKGWSGICPTGTPPFVVQKLREQSIRAAGVETVLKDAPPAPLDAPAQSEVAESGVSSHLGRKVLYTLEANRWDADRSEPEADDAEVSIKRADKKGLWGQRGVEGEFTDGGDADDIQVPVKTKRPYSPRDNATTTRAVRYKDGKVRRLPAQKAAGPGVSWMFPDADRDGLLARFEYRSIPPDGVGPECRWVEWRLSSGLAVMRQAKLTNRGRPPKFGRAMTAAQRKQYQRTKAVPIVVDKHRKKESK